MYSLNRGPAKAGRDVRNFRAAILVAMRAPRNSYHRVDRDERLHTADAAWRAGFAGFQTVRMKTRMKIQAGAACADAILQATAASTSSRVLPFRCTTRRRAPSMYTSYTGVM